MKREPSPAPTSPICAVSVEAAAHCEVEGEEEETFTPDRERHPPIPSRPPVERREVPDRQSPRAGSSRWVGPIRAYQRGSDRREPAPCHGRHFGKNNGTKKQKRNRDFQRRQGHRGLGLGVCGLGLGLGSWGWVWGRGWVWGSGAGQLAS